MEHKKYLIPRGHIPRGKTPSIVRGHRHGAIGKGRVDVAEAAPGLVHVQQAVRIGLLGFHGDGGGQHRVVHHAVHAHLRAVATALVPHHRGADVFVTVVIRSVIAEFFSLVHERLAGRGEHHRSRLLLLRQILPERLRGAILVMVCHEDGRYSVLPHRRMVGDKAAHRGHIAGCIAVQRFLQLIEVSELEAGVDALVVALLDPVRIPNLSNHEDVVGVPRRLISGIAVIIPLV